MADTLDCRPCYDGRPDYDPAGGSAVLPIENSRRARLFGAGTFFRSKLNIGGDPDFQGSVCNDIAVEVVIQAQQDPTDDYIVFLYVYFQNERVETFTAAQPWNCGATVGMEIVTTQAFRSLRQQLDTSSNYLTMPPRGTDIDDRPSGMEIISDATCVTGLRKTNLSGGSGPGTSDSTLSAIRTGPQRTLAFIQTKEDSDGDIFEPREIIQFDYDARAWIPYVQDGDCALPENRCP